MSTTHDIAAALERAEAVLRRRPETGLHEDAGATARWQRGLRFVTAHANGAQVPTDLPRELGGDGEHVTPGWLFRAGIASCAGTSIALVAAAEGIELIELEVRADSMSDTRGLLGMTQDDGTPVACASTNLRLGVRIRAHGASHERLNALVEKAMRRSPIPNAVLAATPIALTVDAEDDPPEA